MKFNQLNFSSSWKIFLPLFLTLILFSGSLAAADIPVVKVRFANPYFDCPTKNYCVDVEFMSDTPYQQLFGMNVRFFYDDKILEYLYMGDFAAGYDTVSVSKITGPSTSGINFGFTGRSEWINGKVQKVSNDTPPVYISTTTWTKLFNVCFHVDDPNSINIYDFCPCIVWDLQENPSDPVTDRGYLHGDDSVIISLVDPTTQQESSPTSEVAIHLNWEYHISKGSFGNPVSITCVNTTCGYVIPLANWSLFLAIGLMLVASVFIYRRRISA